MSIRTNSKSIGNNDAKSATIAATIRKAWLKAKPEAQAEMHRDFMIGWLAGSERISLSAAEAIIVAGKGKNATNPAAIDRAYSAFVYHIAQGKAKAAPQAPKKRNRYSAELREAGMDFLANFEGENLNEQIAKAIALLNALK